MKKIALCTLLALVFASGQFVCTEEQENIIEPVTIEHFKIDRSSTSVPGFNFKNKVPVPVPPAPAYCSQPPVPPQVDDKEMVVLQVLICESPWDENGLSLAETVAERVAKMTVATRDMFSRGPEMSEVMKQLEQEGKLTILSRPQIMTLDQQKATVLIGDQDESGQVRGLFLEITPRIWKEKYITTNLHLKHDSSNEQGVQITTTVTIQDGVPLLLGGLLTRPNPDAPAKEVSLCLVGKIVKR